MLEIQESLYVYILLLHKILILIYSLSMKGSNMKQLNASGISFLHCKSILTIGKYFTRFFVLFEFDIW